MKKWKAVFSSMVFSVHLGLMAVSLLAFRATALTGPTGAAEQYIPVAQIEPNHEGLNPLPSHKFVFLKDVRADWRIPSVSGLCWLEVDLYSGAPGAFYKAGETYWITENNGYGLRRNSERTNPDHHSISLKMTRLGGITFTYTFNLRCRSEVNPHRTTIKQLEEEFGGLFEIRPIL